MPLESFVPKTRLTGDKIDLRESGWYGRPMLVTCKEFSDTFTSKMKGGAIVDAVWADVVDLLSGKILINVLFTNGNIVDNLKDDAGRDIVKAVKIRKQAGGDFGGYAVLDPLEAAEQELANAWYGKLWHTVAEERSRREAAAKPLTAPAAAPQQFPAATSTVPGAAPAATADPMFQGGAPAADPNAAAAALAALNGS